MDTVDIIRKAEHEDGKKLLVFNPLKEDYRGKWDGEELPEYLIPSQENKAFKTSLARHFARGIVDLYISDKKNYPRKRAEKLVLIND